MKKHVDFRYHRIGDTCMVDQKMMERLFRYLKREGIEVKDIPAKANPYRRGKVKKQIK